jgi:hypothetical protein
MRQRAVTIVPPPEEFDSDDFFSNDFLHAEPEDEEIGADLDRSGTAYMSSSERIKHRALSWFGRARH